MVSSGNITSAYVDLAMLGTSTYKFAIGGTISGASTYGILGIVNFSVSKLTPVYAFVNSQNTNLSNVVFYVYAR